MANAVTLSYPLLVFHLKFDCKFGLRRKKFEGACLSVFGCICGCLANGNQNNRRQSSLVSEGSTQRARDWDELQCSPFRPTFLLTFFLWLLLFTLLWLVISWMCIQQQEERISFSFRVSLRNDFRVLVCPLLTVASTAWAGLSADSSSMAVHSP